MQSHELWATRHCRPSILIARFVRRAVVVLLALAASVVGLIVAVVGVVLVVVAVGVIHLRLVAEAGALELQPGQLLLAMALVVLERCGVELPLPFARSSGLALDVLAPCRCHCP